MEVFATTCMKVDIDPVSVIGKLGIIPSGDWIVVRGNKFIQMTEQSAGQHSFDYEVGEVSKEVFDAYNAQQTLIKFLEKRSKQ